MTISAVVAALQTKHAAITGVTKAPTAMPDSLNTEDMPIVLVVPGEANWTGAAVGVREITRTYIVRCYILPVGQGEGVDQPFQQALGILDAMGQAYLDDQSLGLANTYVSENFADSGLDGRLLFAGTEYRGFEIRLGVTQKW